MYPGWNNLFYHAFVNNMADPSIKQTITVPVYLRVLEENILNIKGIIAFIGLADFICIYFFYKKPY